MTATKEIELERQYVPIDGIEWRSIILRQIKAEFDKWSEAINQKAIDAICRRLEWLMSEGGDFTGARVYDRCSHDGRLRVSLEKGVTAFTCEIDCRCDIGWLDGTEEIHQFQFVAHEFRFPFDGRVDPDDDDWLSAYNLEFSMQAQHPDETRQEFDMPLPTPVVVANQIVDRPVIQHHKDPVIMAKQEELGVVFNSVEPEMD